MIFKIFLIYTFKEKKTLSILTQLHTYDKFPVLEVYILFITVQS